MRALHILNLGLVIAMLAGGVDVHVSQPQPATKSGSTKSSNPEASGALPIRRWRNGQRAGLPAMSQRRRKEMRKVTRALKQPCRYCHTPDFKGYTEKLLISQQMMALSAATACMCGLPQGKEGYTEMGQRAQKNVVTEPKREPVL